MLDYAFAFGINPRATALVMRPIDGQRTDGGWSPEWNLDALARRGNDAFCRGFGQLTLEMLGIYHPQLRTAHAPLFDRPTQPEQVFDAGASNNVHALSPTDHTGRMMPGRVVIGIADNRSALELFTETCDAANVTTIGRSRYLPFAELMALGPEHAATSVGDRLLINLVTLHPAVFERFPPLYQPEKGANND